MHDAADLPDDPSTGEVGEVVSSPVEAPEPSQQGTGGASSSRGWRWFPETIGGALYLGMLAVALAALVVVVLGDWRVGIRMFAGVLFAGAALRLVLPTTRVGMLAVRSRPIDVFMHLTVGFALVVLAGSIPDQPV